MKKDDFKYQISWEAFRCELADDYGILIPFASIFNELSKRQFVENGSYVVTEKDVVYDIYSLLEHDDEVLLENRVFPNGTMKSYTLTSKKVVSQDYVENIHTIAENLGYVVRDIEKSAHSYSFKLVKK